MIKAKNTLLNISCCARLTTVETLPTGCQHDTDALFHDEHVLQCVKIPFSNLNEVRQSGTHASFSVFDCDKYIERKLLSLATRTLSRDEGRV